MLVEFEIMVYADPVGLLSILHRIEELLESKLSKKSWRMHTTVLEPNSEQFTTSEYLAKQFSIENPDTPQGGRTLNVIHIGIIDTIDVKAVNEFGAEIIKSFSPESFTEIPNMTVSDKFPWELSSNIIEDAAGRARFFANYPAPRDDAR